MSERELSPYTESVEVQDDNNNGLPSPAHPSISTTLDEVDLLLHQDTVNKDHISPSLSMEDVFDNDNEFAHVTCDQVDDHISAFKEDEFVRQALEQGMDLREYAQQIAQNRSEVQRDIENDHTLHLHSFLNLHAEIQSCDDTLRRMEELLSVFQSDLGNISGEIRSLQEHSSQMNIKLKNRKAVESKLGKVLQGMVISPESVKKITEGQIDEIWLQYLLSVNRQMRFAKANQNKPIKALRNVGPELEKLRLKAAGTIRDFFIERIHALLVPNTNVQIMQQSVFLKYKALHQFVMERHQDAATEIRQTYINALRWYFHNHFERYSKGLNKLQTITADKSDLIGEEHGRKGGLFSGSKLSLKDKANVFSLGDRIETLRMQDQGVILVHIAEDKEQRYQFEQLFRSFNLTLIDNASSEYLFIHEFFSSRDAKKSADITKMMFQEIFQPTEKVGEDFTKNYVENSYDAVGILLCIRINTQLALELQRRRVPALERYTNSTNMILWPRFQHVMTLHVDSLKRMANTKSILNSIKDIHPHYITRRYAEFAASLLVLNEGYDDAILTNSIHKLRNEFEGLLSRMANEFTEGPRRIAFLINNYDVIASVFQETQNRALENELEHVQQLLSLHTGAFVDEQLKPYFGQMMACVKLSEQSDSVKQTETDDLQRISHHFAQTWRQSLTSINASVIQYFSNFKNGTAVLHAVLGQLIVYYTKFLDLLEQRVVGGVQPVGVQTVMVEIKKFRNTF